MAEDKSKTEHRIIYMQGEFNEEKNEKIITRLFDLERDNPSKDILIYIDSYGGHCHSFLAMHDAVRMLRCDVATVCIGKAMSCGQMLLISGTKGKRFITPNARVLVHQMAGWYVGQLRDVELHLGEGKELEKLFNRLILKYTKMKKTDLDKCMSQDAYFSAEQTLKFGLVDHIITSPKVLYDKIK